MSAVRFWEARVADGRLDAALAWVREVLEPAVRAAGADDVEVLVSPADPSTGDPPRIVVLQRWSADPATVEPVPPTHDVPRCHAWTFHPA